MKQPWIACVGRVVVVFADAGQAEERLVFRCTWNGGICTPMPWNMIIPGWPVGVGMRRIMLKVMSFAFNGSRVNGSTNRTDGGRRS